MKKLLSILAAVTLTSTAAITTVACSDSNKDTEKPTTPGEQKYPELSVYDKLIGTNIKKNTGIPEDEAKDTWGFTNFYTLGDSLSDMGGFSTAIGAKLNALKSTLLENETIKGLLEGALGDLGGTILPLLGMIDITSSFGGPNLEGGFTDGKTAAAFLAEKIGLTESEDFTTAVNFNTKSEGDLNTDKVFDQWGRNYAIGATTASNTEGIMGMVLNSFQIHDQARSLIKQHNVKSTDLVIFETGGNDLMNMLDKDHDQQQFLLNEAMSNIRYALLTLLNNGMGNVVVLNAPNISKIPRMITDGRTSDEIKRADELSKEFNARLKTITDELSYHFDGAVKLYDLENKFNTMLDEFKAEGGIVDVPATKMLSDMKINIKLEINDLEPIELDLLNEIIPAFTLISEADAKIKEVKPELSALEIIMAAVSQDMSWTEGLTDEQVEAIGEILNSVMEDEIFGSLLGKLMPVLGALGEGIENFKAAIDLNMANAFGSNETGFAGGAQSQDEIDKYFFFDEVHPTKWGHEKVADDLFELVKTFEDYKG
ncbi:SGNH/GDSL hydrolase family protein [[Acholeplasma] multilocale]|uniref:SGNH/GDSL hydrolase family protein n=1 Tax=[Acholeplasma] multilocale TaxID=264638 RepID=UPI00047B79FB|nr:SGNH/GDSL hydrolase family protein [[Acholeplasma] multilocale]